ncbi:hypothetical protein [Pseudoclavibacter sp. RFBB5]|uniref:hypothetical protein n=1 Tax=Pseudoclavibacter sp. RFBB5 TaxID=2080574 RepID=UPI000CE817CC|nr:hypothetical protein [Pseudoclavibacter sp. RFBB5]PPG29646.1 hypothetical protein C5B97_11785 [Pseudoclavibacter sp. RFBB5]
MARVTPPDLELWLADYGRSQLPGVMLGNKFPGGELPDGLIVIQDFSGIKTPPLSFERRVGFTVIAGTRSNDKPAGDLARLALGIFSDPYLPFLDGPITSIDDDDIIGPERVAETQDRARCYFTVGYTVVGST